MESQIPSDEQSLADESWRSMTIKLQQQVQLLNDRFYYKYELQQQRQRREFDPSWGLECLMRTARVENLGQELASMIQCCSYKPDFLFTQYATSGPQLDDDTEILIGRFNQASTYYRMKLENPSKVGRSIKNKDGKSIES